MTLPMSFKVRVDQSSPVLFCCLCAMIPRVTFGCQTGVTVKNIPTLNYTPGMFWRMIVCQIIPPLRMTGVWKCNF